MTWQTFLDFSTMAHRHLVFVYAGVLVAQSAYFAWTAWNWRRAERNRN
jgi:hypothetical protein